MSSFPRPPVQQTTDDFTPIWFDLDADFYVDLKRIAGKRGQSMAQALVDAVRNLDCADSARISPEALAKKRWSKTTPEERGEFAKKLARARWKRATE